MSCCPQKLAMFWLGLQRKCDLLVQSLKKIEHFPFTKVPDRPKKDGDLKKKTIER
jgi:hypothetical protein